jgi:hypothetical protein
MQKTLWQLVRRGELHLHLLSEQEDERSKNSWSNIKTLQWT